MERAPFTSSRYVVGAFPAIDNAWKMASFFLIVQVHGRIELAGVEGL